MNRYVQAGTGVLIGFLKTACLKLTRNGSFHSGGISRVSPRTEITLDKRGSLTIGKGFKMRSGSKLRVRPNAYARIGDNFSMSNNCYVVCRDSIQIGNDVILALSVKIYDHDHDFCCPGGVCEGKYKTRPISIGNNVWIGADVVILKGTVIGENCVIGAGCILSGTVPSDSVVIQKREIVIKTIQEN